MKLYYEDHGQTDGCPLVLVHGALSGIDTSFGAILPLLAKHRRVIAVELQAHGHTPDVDRPLTVEHCADDVVELLDRLGIERPVVAGLSMGGYVALAMWRRHRRRIRALVLLDTRAGADSDESRAKRRQQIETVRSQGPVVLAAQLLPGQLGDRTRERHPEVVEDVRMMLARAPVEGIVGALEAMISRPDSTPTLRTIDVPTLIVVGEEDSLTPPAEARKLHEGIAGSRLELISGAGHLSSLERPAAVNHVLSEFIARLEYS